MLSLPRVTLLCYAVKRHNLSAVAIVDVVSCVHFGAMHCWSDKASATWCHPARAEDHAQREMWHTLPRHVETTHALFMQWDSGVINPNAWDDAFLDYDYIGAPWPWHLDGLDVGCGGFTLRSKRLMDYLIDHADEFPVPDRPEDHVLCREYRPALERAGFRWAPKDVAARFAWERGHPPEDCFGWHGLYNMPLLLPRKEMERRAAMMGESVRAKCEWDEMKAIARMHYGAFTVDG